MSDQHDININFNDDSTRGGSGAGGGTPPPEDRRPESDFVSNEELRRVQERFQDMFSGTEEQAAATEGVSAAATNASEALDLTALSLEDLISSFDELPGATSSSFQDILNDIQEQFEDFLSTGELPQGPDPLAGDAGADQETEALGNFESMLNDAVESLGNMRGSTVAAASTMRGMSGMFSRMGRGAAVFSASLGGAAGAAATLFAGIGGFIGGVAVFMGAMGALKGVVRGIVAMMDGLLADAGRFSLILEKARIETIKQRLQDQMDVARQAGRELAGLETDKSDMLSAFREVAREFTEFISPFLSIFLKLMTFMLTATSTILKVLNLILEAILKSLDVILFVLDFFLGFIPLIGPLIKDLRAWIARTTEQDIAVGTFADQLTEMFDPANIFGGEGRRGDRRPPRTPRGPKFKDPFDPDTPRP